MIRPIRPATKSILFKVTEVYETPGKQAGAPILVYCPGLGARVEYTWVVQNLIDDKYGFVQFSFAGHNNLVHLPEDLQIDKYAQHVAHWINTRKSNNPIVLVGHSMGAAIAALTANRVTNLNVKSLVLAAPYGPACFNLRSWALIKLMSNLGMVQYWYKKHHDDLSEDVHELYGLYVDFLQKHPQTIPLLLRHLSLLSTKQMVAQAYASLRTPATLILGDEDPITPCGASKRFFTKYCSKINTIILEGEGHLFPVEEPEKFVEIIQNELQKVSK